MCEQGLLYECQYMLESLVYAYMVGGKNRWSAGQPRAPPPFLPASRPEMPPASRHVPPALPGAHAERDTGQDTGSPIRHDGGVFVGPTPVGDPVSGLRCARGPRGEAEENAFEEGESEQEGGRGGGCGGGAGRGGRGGVAGAAVLYLPAIAAHRVPPADADTGALLSNCIE